MTNSFQKTVNLKDKLNKKSEPKTRQRKYTRNDHIDKMYNDHDEDDAQGSEMHKIDQPVAQRVNEKTTKKIVWILLAAVLLAVFYFGVLKKEVTTESTEKVQSWYSIKLVNDEVYYGQIDDTSADPVILNNVYYSYDQAQGKQVVADSGNLRLVKRGKETHGPDGTMSIIRSQVLYMEPLKDDSKVLQAILDYEQ